MRLLVTGGAGFIGSNFVRLMLEHHPDYEVVNLDKLTYAGNLENLAGLEDNPRLPLRPGRHLRPDPRRGRCSREGIDAVVNFAAESHVDRSILDASRVRPDQRPRHADPAGRGAPAQGRARFVQVSTDEVYGSLGRTGHFTEETPLAPNSPYSASKAAADLLVRAYHHTYGLPVVITRCSNNYGPYQFPEKLIPLLITNALADKPLPVYGDGLNVRDWIHVRDHCRAIDGVLAPGHGRRGLQHRRAAGDAQPRDRPADPAELCGKPRGPDPASSRTARATTAAMPSIPRRSERELGWKPEIPFDAGMQETIDWYPENVVGGTRPHRRIPQLHQDHVPRPAKNAVWTLGCSKMMRRVPRSGDEE